MAVNAMILKNFSTIISITEEVTVSTEDQIRAIGIVAESSQ
jgi:hypothetical protein